MTMQNVRVWTPEEPSDRRVESVTVMKLGRDGAGVLSAGGERLMLPVTEMARPVEVGDSFYALSDEYGMVSTADPELLVLLLDGIVPEVRTGAVRVMGAARIPGVRMKLMVAPTEEGVQALPPIIGKGAVRVRDLAASIGDDRIDVVNWSEDRVQAAIAGFAPARAQSGEDLGDSIVLQFEEGQMHSALGKSGSNVRLVSALLGCPIELEAV